MKLNFLKVGFYATMFAMSLFLVACGGGNENHDDHDHQHQGQEQHDHDHEGHQHEQGEEHQHEQEESSIDESGKEFTSAYICPMHCEGSGSDKAGNCPVCKMDYVKNENLKN